MRQLVVAAAAGLTFALGLLLSGMTQPAKVIAFLDIGGAWDPSLMFVMVGAIGVHGAWSWWKRAEQKAPVGKIDAALVGGATLFGVGWGMAGYCPGPVLVAAGAGRGDALVFVLGMVGGMGLLQLARRLASGGWARVPSEEP